MRRDLRLHQLMTDWEHDHSAWIGGTHISHKCTNREYQPVGLGLIAALVSATVNELRVK